MLSFFNYQKEAIKNGNESDNLIFSFQNLSNHLLKLSENNDKFLEMID